MHHYRAWGLRVHSAIPLPFDSLPAGSSADADVVVRLGSVPVAGGRATAARVTPTHYWEIRDGTFLLHAHGVAKYLVSDARYVSIEPLGGDDDDIVAFLLSSPLSVLLMQRGVVPLHASSVETDAGAVVLLGNSGVGKSTLAAELTRRGHPLMADDVTGVVLGPGGRPQALPAFSQLRLWRDTLDRMDYWRRRAGAEVRRDVKKHWVQTERHCATPRPVCTAFVLHTHSRSDVAVEPVPPGDAFWEFLRHTPYRRSVEAIGRRSVRFRIITTMARCVPVVRVLRPTGRSLRLEELAECIEAFVLGQGRMSAPGQAGSFPLPDGVDGVDDAGAAGSSAMGIVWLASYLKSGNTWLRAVLTNYLDDGGEPASINALAGRRLNSRRLFDEHFGVGSADMTDEEVARHLPRFREFLAERLFATRRSRDAGDRRNEPVFVKTHSAYRIANGAPLFPRTGTAGVVCLVRNPLDVAVSFAHHESCAVDDAIRAMANPAAADSRIADGICERLPEAMTTWSGHVSSWMEQTDLRIHVARYEDLVENPRTGFGAIIRFAGLECDGARLDRAIGHAAFPVLRAQEVRDGFREKRPGSAFFFRAGVAGSWRTALTPPQVQAIVDAHGEVMGRHGYLREAEAFLANRRGSDPAEHLIDESSDFHTLK